MKEKTELQKYIMLASFSYLRVCFTGLKWCGWKTNRSFVHAFPIKLISSKTMEQNVGMTFRFFCYLCSNNAMFFDNISEKEMDAHI